MIHHLNDLKYIKWAFNYAKIILFNIIYQFNYLK